eukprot:TRINITY_DN18583_c0_g1_i1.p1 TRINITY_DN18583_c0_g1~~TRINITY_DN18583_c0_g1_i1.p1  ORF type:complete len:540 (+),score=39.84 TRINITY_DN18583_c0_g1_i1:218-1621(+)
MVETSGSVGGMGAPGGIGLRDWSGVEPCCTMMEWAMMNAGHYNVTSPVWQPDNYVGEANFKKMLATGNVSIYTGETVQPGTVTVQSKRITEFCTTNYCWSAGYFVDASYEGLLMREASDFTWGREAISEYNESYAGVRDNNEPRFPTALSAVFDNGTLIPFVNGDPQPAYGTADRGVMGWSFRACVTSNTENQVPFPKPLDYNPEDFTLMKRYILSLPTPPTLGSLFSVTYYRGYPANNKWDLCDYGSVPVTSDVVDDAISAAINGSHSDRLDTYNRVKYYVQGYLYFLQNDPSVPAATKSDVLKWGLCKDEWPQYDHFPPQMYLREGLRMVGDKVFTQNDWETGTSDESIGLGGWGIDIHVVHRRANGSHVIFDEGYFSPGTGNKNFQLPLSLILPKAEMVTNLLATSTPSCTHVTWACIREEPSLWLLGMAAGTTISLMQPNQRVQDVSIPNLQASLQKQGVTLH